MIQFHLTDCSLRLLFASWYGPLSRDSRTQPPSKSCRPRFSSARDVTRLLGSIETAALCCSISTYAGSARRRGAASAGWDCRRVLTAAIASRPRVRACRRLCARTSRHVRARAPGLWACRTSARGTANALRRVQPRHPLVDSVAVARSRRAQRDRARVAGDRRGAHGSRSGGPPPRRERVGAGGRRGDRSAAAHSRDARCP